MSNKINSTNKFNSQSLCDFLERSPTPFHAVQNTISLLETAGFKQLIDGETWTIKSGGKYFATRNDSAIIAFKIGNANSDQLHIIGAHTDSPCLKIKPNADIKTEYFQVGVEVYGGALLNPWFDRDLSIAGRVSGLTKQGDRFEEIINFKKAVASIPSLAIHLDRDANKNRSINAQMHLPLLLSTAESMSGEDDFKSLVLTQCKTDGASEILDYELSCYDTQSPAVIGLNDEFISSARLDNLLSTYIGVIALIESNDEHNSVFVSTDHEEVGSSSACGAQGPFLGSVLEQIAKQVNDSNFHQMIQRSRLISVDNAHALHPNYREKHDLEHSPIINKGPVIKINANQRYASNSVTSADFRHLCAQNDIPVQSFVTRSDMGCGSTIGPISATELGIQTLDIGIPQLGMHSIRELAGLADCEHMLSALTAFLNR
jgi:aspartyl aminopeptidase